MLGLCLNLNLPRCLPFVTYDMTQTRDPCDNVYVLDIGAAILDARTKLPDLLQSG